MKPLATLLLLLFPLTALAQQGTVRYEETVKLEIKLPPEMKHLEQQIPSQHTTARLLFFDESASLMKTAPAPEAKQLEAETSGMRFRMMASRADEETYTAFDTGLRVEKRDFLGRTFLVKDETPAVAWRLTGEQSTFLGYQCQKAVARRDTVAVEAWFTPEIPVPAGPGIYGGLPGLILVLTEGEGRRTFVAKEVTLEAPPAGTLQAPTKGKEVTRAEFDAIVEEKMKEMGAQRGAGSSIEIRIRN